MDYKNSKLFKALAETEGMTVSGTIDAGEYDMRFDFSVADDTLQTQVFAVIGRLVEQPIFVGEKHEEEMFVTMCEQFEDAL